MPFINATTFDRKSGGAQWRDLCVDALSWKCFSTERAHRPRRALAMILLMLALVGCAAAAEQALGQAGSFRGRIAGRVVDARSGVALARCSVEIEPVAGHGEPQSLITEEDGQFRFDRLAPDKYRLTASKRGYLPQAYEQHDDYSTAIAVGPELDSDALIFKVVPEAVLSGVITDERGETVRGAEVSLFQDHNGTGSRSTELRQRVRTDDRGVYEIADIAPGDYFLSVSGQPWYAHRFQPMQSNDRQETETDSLLDVAYPTTFYPQVTESDAATPIPIKGGERITANMTLTAQRAMRLQIKLPAPDAEHRGNYNIALAHPVFGQMEPVATAGIMIRDEMMEVDSVLPGHYDVTLNHFVGDGSAAESTHFSADVAAGATELTAADSAAEALVAGRVTSPDGKIPPGGWIMFRPPHQYQVYRGTLNEAGEFSVKVAPGEYEVVGQIAQMYLARITSQDGEVKGHLLQVKAGDPPRLQIVAGRGFAEIDGIAQRGKQPASGVMVLLAPDDNQTLFGRDQSDSDGTFTLGNIVPGHYHLLAIERGWELEWANRNVLNAFLKKSVPVEVRANDKLVRTVEVQSP